MPKIKCKFCSLKFLSKDIHDHYEKCFNYVDFVRNGFLVRFISYGLNNDEYYVYAFVGINSSFEHIDKFLRKLWCQFCEYCNHDSLFKVINGNEINKKVLLKKYKEGDRFQYIYDMGATTEIFLEILKKIVVYNESTTIRIIALTQNNPPNIKCIRCKNKATNIYCDEFICKMCYNENENNIMLLNIENSPRIGICGYR